RAGESRDKIEVGENTEFESIYDREGRQTQCDTIKVGNQEFTTCQ
ncbi:unnamed protein product, partial [marine sediment metagenome]